MDTFSHKTFHNNNNTPGPWSMLPFAVTHAIEEALLPSSYFLR